jgi:thiol-disulfide isomerase/thioredoxin
MKKILAVIFLITAFAHGQYSIKGTMNSTLESDWMILYKIEGTRQKFIKNTKIKIDTITLNGKKNTIGIFEFYLPTDTKPGAYRVTYRLEYPGFIDFIFNKENISFTFDPDYPNQTVSFSESEENIFYSKYLKEISATQQKLDSLQITSLQNSNLNLKQTYKTTLKKLNTIQKQYLDITENSYVNPLIRATLRANPSEIQTSPEMYMSNMTTTFFDNISFSDETLLNSSFLVDRITDYVFYINYSDDAETQQKLYKKSIETVLSKITNMSFKKDILEFLVAQFESTKNLELIDYLFENHYNKLPEKIKNNEFLMKKKTILATEVGRIAPDFSWTESGKNLQLSTLNDAKNYVLVFWSTGCSHCLKEIPELHAILKDKKELKVVAFSLEKNNLRWAEMKKTLPNWHHVLGLNKWENQIARTYNIVATPTYMVLDANKKIIAKPEQLKDLQKFIDKL